MIGPIHGAKLIIMDELAKQSPATPDEQRMDKAGIQNWIDTIDSYGEGQLEWTPTKKGLLEVCRLALKGLAASETAPLDDRNFYELCQQYRHAKHDPVVEFQAIIDYLTTGKLPWPSYVDPEWKPSSPSARATSEFEYWQSVDVKLPDESGWYHVWAPHGVNWQYECIEKAYYRSSAKAFDWNLGYPITHWNFLPRPPGGPNVPF